MTDNDILNLAVICKLLPANAKKEDIYADDLINFGGLIAALEREECANMCEAYISTGVIHELPRSIRARGKK